LVVVIARIDEPAELWRSVVSVAGWPLAAALALDAVTVYLKTERWRVLLASRGQHYRLGRALGAFLASLYLGVLTPGRVGDVLRVQYLRHDLDMPYAEGLAVVVMDRLCDIYVLLGFTAVGVAHFTGVLAGRLAWVSWAAVVVVAVAPLALLVPRLAGRLMRRLYSRLAPAEHAGGLDRFLRALRAQLGRGLLWAVPLTVTTFLVNYGQGWLLARALGLSISYYEVMCMLAVTSLLGLLPVSVAGVGVREAFLALVFPSLGLRQADGVAFGMLVLVVIYLAFVAIGAVAWQLAPPPVGSGASPERAREEDAIAQQPRAG